MVISSQIEIDSLAEMVFMNGTVVDNGSEMEAKKAVFISITAKSHSDGAHWMWIDFIGSWIRRNLKYSSLAGSDEEKFVKIFKMRGEPEEINTRLTRHFEMQPNCVDTSQHIRPVYLSLRFVRSPLNIFLIYITSVSLSLKIFGIAFCFENNSQTYWNKFWLFQFAASDRPPIIVEWLGRWFLKNKMVPLAICKTKEKVKSLKIALLEKSCWFRWWAGYCSFLCQH